MRDMIKTKVSKVKTNGLSDAGKEYGKTLNPHARVNGSGQKALN